MAIPNIEGLEVIREEDESIIKGGLSSSISEASAFFSGENGSKFVIKTSRATGFSNVASASSEAVAVAQ